MRLTFLGADVPLSKSYALDGAGRLVKTSYPSVWKFSSYEEDVEDLATFAAVLKAHAARGHCLLKGNVGRALLRESRAGSTDANAITHWVCLDLDRFHGSLDDVLGHIGVRTVDHILQYSSAFRLERDRGLTCHLMLRLADPVLPAALKLWLMWKNLSVPAFAGHIQLTKTNTALSWPLDITTCQNDKLLYIAPPVLGAGLEDPVPERIQYVERRARYLELGLEAMPTAEQLKQQVEAKVNELRQAKGLPARKFSYRLEKTTGLEVLAKTDRATLTGLRRERGFVYFNLNGGDSWGYWHPEERPEVIRNFKGEPDYLTAEILPDYWATVVAERKERDIAEAVSRKAQKEALQAGGDAPSGPRVLVFRDFDTGAYYNGTFDGTELVLAQARSKDQLQDFLLERGLPELDFIPTWSLTFDPHSEVRVDFEGHRVNWFSPSRFMAAVCQCCANWPTIHKLLEHAVARDPRTLDHFVNWLACIFRYRDRTLTAWVLHGIQGTGKGLLVNRVLKPLLKYVTIKRMEELEEPFNEYLEQSLLTVVDEAQVSESRKSKAIMANMKNQITEPTISVRRMYASARVCRNYNNWLLLSNMPDPVVIDVADRRFNVGEFRREMLVISDEEIAAIDGEVEAFAAYLWAYPADRARARTVLNSEERERIIQTSQTSAELVAEALRKGMLEVFWEELPSGASDLLPVHQQLLLTEYTQLVHAAVMEGKNRFTRDELRVVFEYLCGEMPKTPTKFTQLLRHRNIEIRMMRIPGYERALRGFETEWRVDPDWLAARQAELSLPKGVTARAA